MTVHANEFRLGLAQLAAPYCVHCLPFCHIQQRFTLLPACVPAWLPALNHLLLQPGRVWELVVDTARAAPYDAYLEGGDVIGWVPHRAGPMLCAMLCAFLCVGLQAAFVERVSRPLPPPLPAFTSLCLLHLAPPRSGGSYYVPSKAVLVLQSVIVETPGLQSQAQQEYEPQPSGWMQAAQLPLVQATRQLTAQQLQLRQLLLTQQQEPAVELDE